MIKARLCNAAALAAGGGGAARNPGEMSPLEVCLTVLSGTELYHFIPELSEEPGLDHGWAEYTRFAFDLDTLEFNPSVPLDFNHDDTEVIGGISLAVEDGKLVGRGAIVPFRPGDRASEVAYKSQFVPYGVSPLVTFDEASALRLKPGQSAAVSGHTYKGPITIVQHARILGAAVTPYPTDTGTGVSALSTPKKGVLTMSILKPDTADHTADFSANLIVNGGAANENPDLPGNGPAADPDPGCGQTPDPDPDPDSEPGTTDPAGPDEGGGETAAGGGETGGGPESPDSEPDGGDGGAGCGCGGNGCGGDGCAAAGGGAGGTGLAAEIESLRNEVKSIREELGQVRAAALDAHGACPTGFSAGKNAAPLSYADAIAMRLEKLAKE